LAEIAAIQRLVNAPFPQSSSFAQGAQKRGIDANGTNHGHFGLQPFAGER
jgi:hypothetical protein